MEFDSQSFESAVEAAVAALDGLKLTKLFADNPAADIDYGNFDIWIRAGNSGSIELVSSMLAYVREKKIEKAEQLNYALYRAGSNGHIPLLEFLLEEGAQLSVYDSLTFRAAARCGKIDMVRLLIKKNVNIHAKDDGAFLDAVEEGRQDVIDCLIDAGVSIHSRKDETFCKAAGMSDRTIFNFLVDRLFRAKDWEQKTSDDLSREARHLAEIIENYCLRWSFDPACALKKIETAALVAKRAIARAHMQSPRSGAGAITARPL